MTRRIFLKNGGAALVGLGLTPAFIARAARMTCGRRKILVAIFQRGGADGLNMVVPFGEDAYYAARPSIAIPRPGADGGAIDLDGFFGFHPRMAPLLPFFKDGSLAIVHACGSPDESRSHFDAQDYMEGALTQVLPRTLQGAAPALAASALTRATGRDAGGSSYPPSEFGHALRQIAQIIKADPGQEVAFAELGRWDHHFNEGGSTGQHADRLDDFATGLAAFARDLGDRMADVVVVTMSEFGRTVKENDHRGTDHGRGNAMLVLGGNVSGGKVYGRWPGLDAGQLYQDRDLAITTDFRDVFAECVTSHMGAPDTSQVFPGHRHTGKLGFIRT